MGGILAGYLTLGTVIAVGWLLARIGIVTENGANVLARISFHSAMPALMVITISRADLGQLISGNLVVSLVSVFVTCLLAVLAARLIWRRDWPGTIVSAFCSCYVNAGNLGLPLAAYVLGDATLVVPMLLVQLLFLQPLGLTALDLIRARRDGTRLSPLTVVVRPLRNPLTVGALVGALLSLVGWSLPSLVAMPLTMLAGLAVPANLLAFGMALRFGARPGAGENLIEVSSLIGLKLVFQPLLAFLLARFVWDLPDPAVLAITVIAALPTAQNVYINANRYGSGVRLARDQVFLSTVASVPVLVAIAGLMHV